jgi:O-antigen/teichoic acid export membrane protein
MARGSLAWGGYIVADAGSSVVKVILILVFIWMLGLKSTLAAVLIHGSSFVIPLIVLQFFRPVKIIFDLSLVNRKDIIEILKFSLPVWLSHASYMSYMTIAIIFLEHYTNDAAVGVFSLASSLSILFSFIPIGFSTFLLPKIAGTPGDRHKKLLYSALFITVLSNLILLFAYYFLAPWCVETFFGSEYLLWPNVYFMVAAVTICLGIQGIITSVFVGKGRAREETKSRLVTFIVTVVACWYFVPAWGALGASWAMLIGVVFGLIVFGFVQLSDSLTIAIMKNKS